MWCGVGADGIIRRNSSVIVDREAFAEFVLTVLAKDNGTPRLNSTATVDIRLQVLFLC